MLPIVVGSVIYVYQIPIKKYLAQRKLYELLEKDYRIERSDIQIDNIIRDTKSARGGIVCGGCVSTEITAAASS